MQRSEIFWYKCNKINISAFGFHFEPTFFTVSFLSTCGLFSGSNYPVPSHPGCNHPTLCYLISTLWQGAKISAQWRYIIIILFSHTPDIVHLPCTEDIYMYVVSAYWWHWDTQNFSTYNRQPVQTTGDSPRRIKYWSTAPQQVIG